MTAPNRTHPAQSTEDPHEGWPEGVFPISVNGLDHLGVGNDGGLFWDGKPIEVRKRLDLTRYQNIVAGVAAASAFIGAVAALVSAYVDLATMGSR